MVIIYPVFIGIALVTAQLAHDKGYSGRWWLLLGFVIPIFSLLVLFMLKRKQNVKPLSRFYEKIAPEQKDKVLFKKEIS